MAILYVETYDIVYIRNEWTNRTAMAGNIYPFTCAKIAFNASAIYLREEQKEKNNNNNTRLTHALFFEYTYLWWLKQDSILI